MLLYAEDIVLHSESEAVQIMLDYLGNWCKTWGLTINFNKSKVVHFRSPSMQSTEYNFKCYSSSSSIDLIHQYKFLGVLFTEHMDLMQMAKIVAQSTSRALGLLISKDDVFGGMPFERFTQCYGVTVQSIIDESAASWGTKSMYCINAVQNRACRYFSGLGRCPPNATINGDMGWLSREHSQWMCIVRKWCRLVNIDESLLAKKIFLSHLNQDSTNRKFWCYNLQREHIFYRN